MNFDSRIRKIPDYPKKGILYYDITTLLKDGRAFKMALDKLEKHYEDREIDLVVGIESRGYMLGGALADRLVAGFVPVRKQGKLPAQTIRATYTKEYGDDGLEIHKDAITPGQNVLIVDDLLATGGTLAATVELVEKLEGKIVGICVLIELAALKGKDKIKYPVYSLVKYGE
ncbi:MAG: adenine phosphoribosyltransferase [archaeon]